MTIFLLKNDNQIIKTIKKSGKNMPQDDNVCQYNFQNGN